MRIRVDLDLCQGHETCTSEAPEVFSVEDGKVVVLEADPPPELHEAVKLAVKYCPTRALSIEEE